jgi:hypothetical protein
MPEKPGALEAAVNQSDLSMARCIHRGHLIIVWRALPASHEWGWVVHLLRQGENGWIPRATVTGESYDSCLDKIGQKLGGYPAYMPSMDEPTWESAPDTSDNRKFAVLPIDTHISGVRGGAEINTAVVIMFGTVSPDARAWTCSWTPRNRPHVTYVLKRTKGHWWCVIKFGKKTLSYESHSNLEAAIYKAREAASLSLPLWRRLLKAIFTWYEPF